MPGKLFLFTAFVMVPCGAWAEEPQIETVGISQLTNEKLSGVDQIESSASDGFSALPLVVTIDAEGRVTDVQVSGETRGKLVPAPGLAAAREWTFRPQSFDGHPVSAVGEIAIAYRVPTTRPDAGVPFPDAAPEETEITLERGACFGTCPDYSVTIRGDGRVRFSTRERVFAGADTEVHRMFNGQNVVWPGVHEAWVDPAEAASLVERFREAHFMGLKPEYVASVTDLPRHALTLRRGDKVKRVVDYVGSAVGMPASVTELELAVDELAGTDRWVDGNAGTIALLKAQGFDFHGGEAAELVAAAISKDFAGDHPKLAEMIRLTIGEGLDLDAPVSIRQDATAQPVGALIAQYAAMAGDEGLFNAMAERGYLAKIEQHFLDWAFAEVGCEPGIARALAEAGADPKAHGSSGNALHNMRENNAACAKKDGARQAEMARTLAGLGVPLEDRDWLGYTPLMDCDLPAVAQALIEAGADVNAKDKNGATPISSTFDDRVAILLLRAGADPHTRDKQGKTLRSIAKERHWPATLAWLDRNGID